VEGKLTVVKKKMRLVVDQKEQRLTDHRQRKKPPVNQKLAKERGKANTKGENK